MTRVILAKMLSGCGTLKTKVQAIATGIDKSQAEWPPKPKFTGNFVHNIPLNTKVNSTC